MDLGAIFLGLAVVVSFIPWVARPFFEQRRQASNGRRKPAIPESSRQLTERRKVLSALNELDFDFQTGKITAEDHRDLRARLMAEAASLTPALQAEDDELEALIRARREALDKATRCGQCGERLSGTDRFCPSCGASADVVTDQTTDQYCPACGSKTLPGAQYCSKCGTKLASQEASALSN